MKSSAGEPRFSIRGLYAPTMRTITLSCLLAAAPVAEAVAQTFAFTDVTVVPMDADRVMEHRTVVVRDGRIVSIVPAADFKWERR